MNISEYNGVWVFAEQRNGELQKVSLEILGEGRRLADELGVKLTAVLLGNNVACLADILGEHGADEILVAEHEALENYTTDGYTKVIMNGRMRKQRSQTTGRHSLVGILLQTTC